MLAIRLQRTGRRGHAQFRLIVQDSRFSPTSGRVVAQIGHYNPHSKEAVIDSEKLTKYLKNGAMPSDRAARLMQKEGIKLPAWVSLAPDKKRAIKTPDKLRRNRPAGAPAPEKPIAEVPAAETTDEAPAEPAAEEQTETPAETAEPAAEEAPATEAEASKPQAEPEAQPAEAEPDKKP